MKLQWYVLKVQTNREQSIRESLLKRIKLEGLERFFGEIIIPTEEVVEKTRSGQERGIERKLYPGYIMMQVALNDDTWNLVRDTSGVGDFAGVAGKPIPMREDEINTMLGREQERSEAPTKIKIGVKTGDVGKIE